MYFHSYRFCSVPSPEELTFSIFRCLHGPNTFISQYMKFLTYSSPELSCEVGKLFSRWQSNSPYSQMLHNPKCIYLVTPNDFPEVFSELHNCMYLLESIIDYNSIYFPSNTFRFTTKSDGLYINLFLSPRNCNISNIQPLPKRTQQTVFWNYMVQLSAVHLCHNGDLERVYILRWLFSFLTLFLFCL